MTSSFPPLQLALCCLHNAVTFVHIIFSLVETSLCQSEYRLVTECHSFTYHCSRNVARKKLLVGRQSGFVPICSKQQSGNGKRHSGAQSNIGNYGDAEKWKQRLISTVVILPTRKLSWLVQPDQAKPTSWQSWCSSSGPCPESQYPVNFCCLTIKASSVISRIIIIVAFRCGLKLAI